MKKRWIAIALLTVLLMGIGGAIGKVGVRQESDGSAYSLYFVERDLRSADGGDALRSEERTLEDGGLSTEELAAALVAELFLRVVFVFHILSPMLSCAWQRDDVWRGRVNKPRFYSIAQCLQNAT